MCKRFSQDVVVFIYFPSESKILSVSKYVREWNGEQMICAFQKSRHVWNELFDLRWKNAWTIEGANGFNKTKSKQEIRKWTG